MGRPTKGWVNRTSWRRVTRMAAIWNRIIMTVNACGLKYLK